MQDHTGKQLGNYRLVRLLGQGGFAQVYLGEHLYLKTQAAIKVLSVELEDDGRRQFVDEAQTIARLVHPHIIRILDFGVESSTNTPYLVMDYAPNGTLRQRYSKGTQLPLTTIVPYVNQIASALHYAHGQNVIHRDVKPGNILLGQDNTVYLSDFGIATIAHNSASQSTEDIILGTIAYMAPEQIQGKPRPASDQYALAIVVYEWLCGDRPFQGSFTEIVAQQMSADPQPLRERLPNISPDVQEIIMIALAKNPKERFASVEIFAHALEQAAIAEQQVGSAHPQASVQPVATPSRPSIAQSAQANASPQAISATIHPAPTSAPRSPRSPRSPHSPTPVLSEQGRTAAPAPSSALPPTLYVGQPSQEREDVSDRRQTSSTARRRRSRVLGLNGSHLIGGLIALLLISGLIVLAGHSVAFPQVNLAGLTMLALLSLLTDIVLVCAAAILGPVIGVLLGAFGYLLGDYINTLTQSGYTMHPLSLYLLSALVGLVVGLFVRGVLGHHKLFRALSLIAVDIIGAVAVAVGLPLALPMSSIISEIVAILLSLLLIPLFLQVCKMIIGHR